MKITMVLSDAQVKGIKAYLHDTCGDLNPKITKKEIEQEIRGELAAVLQSGAIADYIMKFEKPTL